MKNILVVYYSQTGQLREILMNLLGGLDKIAHVDFMEIETSEFFFPLSWNTMFDMFPESVLQKPCDIVYTLPLKEYDTIVLGFQTWFLHLSLPMLTFSQTQDFASLIKDKEVYLVMDCRNSWRQSMNYMEQKVIENQGQIRGRHIFGSKGGLFFGVISILYWFFTGNKQLCLFPEPGVPQSEIEMAVDYGKNMLCSNNEIVKHPFQDHKFMSIEIENFAINKFRKWAVYVTSQNNKYRWRRLFYFQIWIVLTLIVISPFATILRIIKYSSKKRKDI